MKFTKVDRGWYATADGTWAVVVDGYEKAQHVGADRSFLQGGGGYEGYIGGEWALVHDPAGRLRDDHNAGDNINWFDTKREAIAAARRR